MELVVSMAVMALFAAVTLVVVEFLKRRFAKGPKEFIIRDEAGKEFRVKVPGGSTASEVDEAVRRGIERLSAGG